MGSPDLRRYERVYASEVPDGLNHEAADEFRRELARGSHGTLVTTDYVLDETPTLLRMMRDVATALAFAKKDLSVLREDAQPTKA